MKRKAIIIFLCMVWIMICFIGVFVPKEYLSSLPDEISVISQPSKNDIVEFYDITLTKVYRENGKYFLSSQSLKYNTEPKIVELTKKEYRYCTRVDEYRLKNQRTGGSFNYDISVKKGDKEEKYNYDLMVSPLYEIQRIKNIKSDEFDSKNDTDKKLAELENFLDEGKFEMAFLFYPDLEKDGNYRYYYKNACCIDYDDKWNTLHKEYKYEQDLNIILLKKYEKGQINLKDIDLKADLDKKEELFNSITGNTTNYRRGSGYDYDRMLKQDDKPITWESKQYILDKTTKRLDGYDKTAYEYIKYGEDGLCAVELYLPNENDIYILFVKKPFLMPKWYLEWSVNTILLNDEVDISPGFIYELVCFLILTIPVCLGIVFFRFGFKKRKSKKINDARIDDELTGDNDEPTGDNDEPASVDESKDVECSL